MKTSIAAGLCAVLIAVPAFAETAGDDATKPLKPGGVRITTKAPEPDKWDGQRCANGAVQGVGVSRRHHGHDHFLEKSDAAPRSAGAGKVRKNRTAEEHASP